MIKQDYFPVRLGDQTDWMHNLKTTLPQHAAELEIPAADVAPVLLDIDTVLYALEIYRGAVTSFHDAAFRLIEDALDNTQLTGNIAWLGFTTPTPIPAAVAYGALRRIFAFLNNKVKKSAKFTNTIGTNMRVLAPAAVAPDAAATTPVFTLRFAAEGKLEVVWTKGVFDGVKLEFDLGAAGMKADVDLRPNYVLNWLPAAGASAIIKVRLRYLYKGEEFGNWTPWQSWTLTGD